MHSVKHQQQDVSSGLSPMMTNSVFIGLSLALTLHNKYVLDEVCSSSNILLVCQNTCTILILLALRAAGKVQFPLFSRDRNVMFVSLSQALQVVTGLGALEYVNIVVHGVLKRMTCVCSWIIELYFDRKNSTMYVLPSLILMIGGSLIAAQGDLAFSVIGYVLALASCFFQGTVFELGKRVIKQHQSQQQQRQKEDEDELVVSAASPAVRSDESSNNNNSSSDGSGYALVLYNNSLATLIMSLVLVFVSSSRNHQQRGSYSAMVHTTLFHACLHLLLNAALATSMNFSVSLNVVVSSPLSHAVSGNIKAMLQTLLGTMFFEIKLNGLGWAGVAINILAACIFSAVRIKYK